MLLGLPVFLCARVLVAIAKRLAPPPLTYYIYPEETFAYGDMGIAYWVGPERTEQPKPEMFVCNVGFLDKGFDALQIGLSTAEMVKSLWRAHEKGEALAPASLEAPMRRMP